MTPPAAGRHGSATIRAVPRLASALLLLLLAGCDRPAAPAPAPPSPAPRPESRAPAAGLPTVAPIGTGEALRRAFSGTFSSRRITLHISPVGERLTGSLAIKGKPYPLRGELDQEELKGTFTANGREMPFRASLVDRRLLALTCDGRTYELARGGPLPTGARLPGSAQKMGPHAPQGVSGWAGRYSGSLEGLEATLSIHARADGLRGEIRAKNHRYTIKGQAESASKLRGTLDDPMSGVSSGFLATKAGDRLTLSVRLFDKKTERVSLQTLYFQRTRK